jgi:superfamily II DNA or RNA helicase
MTIQIIVNNVWSRIRGLEGIQLIDALDRETSFFVEGYQYVRAYNSGYYDKKTGSFTHWDGKRHLLTNKMVFPTGLLSRVEKFLKRQKQEYEIVDQRITPTLGEPIKIKNYIPRPYQIEATNVAIEKGRGMIRMGTGAGKTLVAAMMVAYYNLPTMIYVVGKDLLYQFHREMEKALGIKVGMIGDGNCLIEKINVCSIWTAITAFDLKQAVSLDDEDWAPEIIPKGSEQKQKIRQAIENTNVAVYDEAHFLATDTIQSIFKASKKCRYLFAMSGTDWRDDGADLLLESVCGERIYNMPASTLIDNGFLVPANITLLEVPPLEEKLPKHYASVYSKYITENDIRNGMIEDSARILIKKGKKLLILVRYLNHGRELAERLKDIPLFFVNGEVDSETRESVKKDFESGNLKCLIASSVFDIGVDLPCLDALILAGGGKSTVRALQRIGRVIRLFPNKKHAIVVDFIDNATYLNKHSATRIAVYKTEPRFKIKFPKDFDERCLEKIKNSKIPKKLRG